MHHQNQVKNQAGYQLCHYSALNQPPAGRNEAGLSMGNAGDF